MGPRRWLIFGAVAGLVAGLIIDLAFDVPTAPLRIVQVVLVLFGAAVALFMYEGSKLTAGGAEPARSTDAPRRRWSVRVMRRGGPRG